MNDRFQAARRVLLADKLMRYLITFGGIGVILAVAGICVFIGAQVIPLFSRAAVSTLGSYEVPAGEGAVLLSDEWSEMPLIADLDGIRLVDIRNGGKVSELELPVKLREGERVASLGYSQKLEQLVLGTNRGRFVVCNVAYEVSFVGEQRELQRELKCVLTGEAFDSGRSSVISQIAYGGDDKKKLALFVQSGEAGVELNGVLLEQKRSLMGSGKILPVRQYELTKTLPGTPRQVLVSSAGSMAIIGLDDGSVCYFALSDDNALELVQRFWPFRDQPDTQISTLGFLNGDASLVVTGSVGDCRVFSLHIPEDNSRRLFGEIRRFKPMRGMVSCYAGSLRNKAFLLVGPQMARLCYMTTSKVRWESPLSYTVRGAMISKKYDRLLLLDIQQRLHILNLNDRYPEASFGAFFSKLWYEGYSKPEYVWQSTGGTDDFESKISMVPLLWGTLKGTFYAMLFAAPVALLAALYTSQFQSRLFRIYVKPCMEIMASLPSVVLGFIGALWLAPYMEDRVPVLFIFVFLLPISAIFSGFLWWRLPRKCRRIVPQGWEFLLYLPVLLLSWQLACILGPVMEQQMFSTFDAHTGQQVADFRVWLDQKAGLRFEQRNSLIVGFVMGFAVIPIIFTIADDALSSVPKGLTTASVALGASRWQTAVRVVLPIASAGIFSAVMMGLGRAVGETMIVVMATGNTPIMECSIFTGMRTLSANIAVELPEAPQGETLYRTLFLGAFLLFCMTFVINTAAELLRQHLREKYRTV